MAPDIGGLGAAFGVQGFWIRVPRGMSDRIGRLERAFDAAWATTWEDDAGPAIGAHLGFGQSWPYVRFWNASRTGTPKLGPIQTWCAENAASRPVAWVDDDLHADAEAWANERGLTHLVRVTPSVGLMDAHVEDLLRWADGLIET